MDCPKDLIYYTDERPGYARKRWGRGFRYFNMRNRPLSDQSQLSRIKSLVIPPAWESVWISPKPNGHLQVTGIDQKGRKQYIYHPDWMNHRQKKKFQHLARFAGNLGKIRTAYSGELRKRSWTKSRVIALILYMLDNFYFRVGNRQYAVTNSTYGITTLRRKHLEDKAEGLAISYTAKSGKNRRIKIGDKRIARLIREISELPGYEVFRYRNEEGKYVPVDSSDVNEYIRAITGENFTAKYFRTWGACRLTVESYMAVLDEIAANSRLKFESTLIRRVAEKMGNTLAVCRDYYIHPDLVKFLAEIQPDDLNSHVKVKGNPDLTKTENQVLTLIGK